MKHWHSGHSGIAAVSFTNVACEEIRQQLAKLGAPADPPYPHYVGTIDGFVDSYIFLPFGSLVMECTSAPELVLPHNRRWVAETLRQRMAGECQRSGKGCDPTQIAYRADGSLFWCSDTLYRAPKCFGDRCHEAKRRMAKAGFALHSDAMYWAAEILERYPHIASALAGRFPELIVDEAQDTSASQCRILETLSSSGCSVVLVGDLDQAIYEFREDTSDRLNEFLGRLPECPLSLNMRSSQLICNAAHHFADYLKIPATAGGETRSHAQRPTLLRYAIADLPRLLDWFGALVETEGIPASGAVVLARTNRTVRDLTGAIVSDWPKGMSGLARAFASAACDRDAGRLADALQTTMRALLKLLTGRSSPGPDWSAVSHIGLQAFRRGAWRVMQALPPLDGAAGDWGPACRQAIQPLLQDYGWEERGMKLANTLKRCSGEGAECKVSDCIGAATSASMLTCKTVHAAKGETHEAIMLVAEPKRPRSRNASGLAEWVVPGEERRIAYVGMTRARRTLVVAIPADTDPALLQALKPDFDVAELPD